MFYSANNSFFIYENNIACIDYYFNYIVNIIKKILLENPNLNLNILFYTNNIFNNDIQFSNKNKLIKIGLNIEHTLVKKNGRGITKDSVIGNISTNDGDKYLVRLVDYDNLNNADIIIDYSETNIFNMSSVFHNLSNKLIYISPSIYNFDNKNNFRNITTLTTFIDIYQPRRYELLMKINNNNINHININNCFESVSLQNLYKNTKILINIHQTEHHHTFEELRVLPALLCGVITICEDSPLMELIPYNDYIIWCSYDKIIEKVLEVINNYDYYYNFIFNEEKNIKLDDLKENDYNSLYKKICFTNI